MHLPHDLLPVGKNRNDYQFRGEIKYRGWIDWNSEDIDSEKDETGKALEKFRFLSNTNLEIHPNVSVLVRISLLRLNLLLSSHHKSIWPVLRIFQQVHWAWQPEQIESKKTDVEDGNCKKSFVDKEPVREDDRSPESNLSGWFSDPEKWIKERRSR